MTMHRDKSATFMVVFYATITSTSDFYVLSNSNGSSELLIIHLRREILHLNVAKMKKVLREYEIWMLLSF